ncbi:IS1 family transposase [Candidatus Poribacteria bacterium]|nr:IS1 family transposase [Candidatus Poribacteria bacterium]
MDAAAPTNGDSLDARPPEKVDAIALDEMWTYEKARKEPKRQSVWIWTAVIEEKNCPHRVFYKVGDRSEETFLRLADRLPLSKAYYTDGYEVYGWLPRAVHHVGKDGPVNRNEGIHSILRDRLCRLRRRTKGYTKESWWLRASLAMICLHLGWI